MPANGAHLEQGRIKLRWNALDVHVGGAYVWPAEVPHYYTHLIVQLFCWLYRIYHMYMNVQRIQPQFWSLFSEILFCRREFGLSVFRGHCGCTDYMLVKREVRPSTTNQMPSKK